MLLVSLCRVCDIKCVCKLMCELFILFLILVFGVNVVIEFIMIMLIVLECINML